MAELAVVSVEELPMDPAALEAAIELEREARVEELAKKLALVKKLAAKRDDSIKAKRPYERMMIDSLRLYEGWDGAEEPTKNAVAAGPTFRVPLPPLLRARTDQWKARIYDLLSNNPWALTPEAGTERVQADGMTKLVQEQLGACRFERTIRRISDDAAMLGFGLAMGPIATTRKVRRYAAQQPMPQIPGTPPMPPGPSSQMVVEETVVPEIVEADPWMFYPDMTERVEKAEFAHYGHLMGSLEIRNLSPGFDEDQINALLRKEPDLGELRNNLVERMRWFGESDLIKNKYVVWRYTGVLDADDLETLGLCECQEEDEFGNALPPPMAMADIWYCQEYILKAKLSPIPDDFRIPYYVFAPFPIQGSMFGKSLPMLGEDSHRVMAGSLAAALHSASVSSGPQIKIDPGALEPADKQWVVRGPKIWKKRADAEAQDFQNGLDVIEIPNTVPQALQLYELGKEMLDEGLNTRQWGEREGSAEQQTASGLAMMMNQNSIMQVMVAATGDDELFEPAIKRMYWWNNDYHEDEAVKGNYQVRPLVQSERLVKDVQIQQMQAFTAFAMGDPEVRANFDVRKMVVAHANMIDAPVTEWLLPEEQVAQNMANQPPDPAQELAMLKAQTENLRAQTEQIKARTEEAKLMREMGPQPGQPGIDPLALANADSEFVLAQEDDAIERERIAADLRIAEIEADTDRMAVAARNNETQVKAQQVAIDKQKDREAKLVVEGMKTEREAQEVMLARQTGSGI